MRTLTVFVGIFLALTACVSGNAQDVTGAGSSVKRLPTAEEAAFEVYNHAKSEGKIPGALDLEKARKQACADEIEAAKNGHADAVSSDDLAACQRQEKETAAQDEYKKKVEQMAKDNHCPNSVVVDTSESCVYMLLGLPQHANTGVDKRKLLMYSDGTYIYIDRRGKVEDIHYVH